MRAGRKLTSVEINAVVYRSDLKKGIFYNLKIVRT